MLVFFFFLPSSFFFDFVSAFVLGIATVSVISFPVGCAAAAAAANEAPNALRFRQIRDYLFYF